MLNDIIDFSLYKVVTFFFFFYLFEYLSFIICSHWLNNIIYMCIVWIMVVLKEHKYEK